MNQATLPILFLLLSVFFEPVKSESLHVHVLDIGEGQAVLLHLRQRAILIDTGHAGRAYEVIDRMQQLGIQNLDYLILTHLHPDHASGYFALQHRYPEALPVDNCQPVAADTQPDMIRWVSSGLKKRDGRRCVSAGDSIEWMGIKLQFLWPRYPVTREGGLNHQSLVIYLEYNQQKLLIMGDADLAAEKEILQRHEISPVDILVVGHHGSIYANSTALLESAKPEYSVISINANNFRGYPDAATVARIEKYSKYLHKTWEQGEFHREFK